MSYTFTSVEEAVAMSTMYAANHLEGVKAIVALTRIRHYPAADVPHQLRPADLRHVSPQQDPGMDQPLPWRHPGTVRRGRDEPVYEVCREALDVLKAKGLVQSGDMVLLTHGDKMETVGSTNTCKVMMVE